MPRSRLPVTQTKTEDGHICSAADCSENDGRSGTGNIDMHIIEIKKQKKGKMLVRTDEVGTFPIYEKEAAAYHLEEGSELSDSEWEKLCAEVLIKRVKRRALYLLQQMDRTEAQLRRKLTEGQYPDFLIDEAVDYVKSYHYIDDLRYASSYIRCHQQQKNRRQLREALLTRGVPADLIDQAFEEEYEDHEEELIERLLEKKQYDPENTDLKEKQKIYQSLLRKGFSAPLVRRCMGLT